VLATARLTLQAALPDELADRVRALEDRFHRDAPAWFREADADGWVRVEMRVEPSAVAVGDLLKLPGLWAPHPVSSAVPPVTPPSAASPGPHPIAS
jgi:hypothetical protein